MYNPSASSTLYSIRSKGYLPHYLNERPIFLNERCNGNPLHLSSSSSCSSCCVCYAFPTHRLPVGPSLFYGSRQSTLLKWSISRRLMLCGRNRFCYTLPEYGHVLDCCEVPFSIVDDKACHCSEGRRYRQYCLNSEGDFECHESDGFDEEDIAEAMISLIREGFGSQGKNRSSKRVEVGNRGKSGAKESSLSSSRMVELENRARRGVEDKRLSSFEKIKVDRKRESGDHCEKEERKSKQNNKVGSIAVELRKNGYKLNGDRLVHSRGDNQSLRKEGSTCSSYYSLSSSGDIEDDAEVEDKNVQFVEEFSGGYRYDSVSDVGEKLDGRIKEEYKSQGDDEKGREEESMRGDTTEGNHANWHLRKNSQKKPSQGSTQVTSSISETSETNWRLSRTRESGYVGTSSSKKKFVDKEEELKMAATLNEQSKQNVSGNKVGGVYINEGKKLAEVSEIRHGKAEEISRSRKRLTIMNENLELDANLVKKASNSSHETVRPVLQEESLRRTSSENRKTERERTSHQISQSNAVINASESTNVHVTSNQEVEERHHQIGNHAIGEMGSRQKYLHLGVISVAKDGNTNTSVSSSEVRTRNEEQNAASFSASNLVAKDKKSSMVHKAAPSVISRKGSQDATNISPLHGTDKVSSTYSEKTYENRIFEQETNKSSVEKTVKETVIRTGRNNHRVGQSESGNEVRDHATKLKVHGLFNSSSQSSYQRIDVNEQENKGSQAMLMPPPSQLVARNLSRTDSTSEMASQIVSRRASGSSSASYVQSGGSPVLHGKSYRESGVDESTGEPTYLINPGDTLGSADHLERLSAPFVGESIEKSRNELLISEIQKEDNVSEVDLLHEEKHRQKNFVDYQTKDHDSKLSSRSSGSKGPSDEMWHVMDSTTEQQPPKTEDPETSAHSENAIVKRSGRSLWNVISDIVRLRWASRAETSDSTLRSGGRNSPNESVSNETWFSGREHEETDNTRIGRTAVSQFTSSDRLEEPKNTYHEVDTPPSPNVMEIKPSSETLLISGEAILTDGRKVDLISSGSDIERSSLPLSPRGSLVIDEISHSGKTDASASSSAERLGRSSDATLLEISTTGTKDGEVKQRKLQRNKQVLKDRFDEWEEAYILETEQRKMDEMFMREALAEARKAADTWEVPVGAVLVKHGKIIARGCNLVEELRDSTAHAEMICIREASKQLKSWRLAETTLYVTLEPCPMCAGAILQARVENLVWGAPNKLLGADGSWIRLFPDGGEVNASEQSEKPAAPVHPFHPKMTIRRGILASECSDVMQHFFQLRRRKKKKENTPPLTIAHHHHPSKFISKMHNIFHILFCL
ncbi:tRNA(adenine(34)) deaminase, chloroplastic [Cucurbita maxima]|uniref:tRNA(adenine(34)) deaminase n=1 Tax=Cucurbita maxima TaxID=3661 RepID=A0A6J1HXT0_CUCMA|nr:tRNA(adenine(34)) deaminase, chloroplastic [Cucurbita maxima]XP_022968650.1 tRNA(adenine(34)) deaminase, chloroplastic [Cucurbita maxima]